MSEPTARVRQLREHALWRLDNRPRPEEPQLLRARAWLASKDEPWTPLRRARATAAVLCGLAPVIDPRELLVGKFPGQESLRMQLLNRAPKHGNDDSVDQLAALVTSWIGEEVRRYRTYLGEEFHSGFFFWVMHERLGRATCASADGRFAGFPLGDGSGQGWERLGPAAAVLSQPPIRTTLRTWAA